MLSQKVQDAFNRQINAELHSSYLYLSMAAYFEDKNLPGFARWLRVQEEEEREHGMKFYAFLVDRGGRVELKAIPAPQKEWKSSMEAFKEVQAHEASVTASINALY